MVGPRPRRQDFYVSGLTGRGRFFRQEAYDNAVGDWERQKDEEQEVKSRYGETVEGVGYTDTYFGGAGVADGPGHGHIRVDEDGGEQVIRESYAFGEPGARREATLDDHTPDRRRG